jgi:hypothetical protein
MEKGEEYIQEVQKLVFFEKVTTRKDGPRKGD